MARWHRAKALTAEDGSLQLAAWPFPKENLYFDLDISSLTLRSASVPDDSWDLHNTESAGPVPTLVENCPHLRVSQLPKQG